MTTQPADDAVTDVDYARARERLSTILGRRVTAGDQVDQLAAEYAACRADGHHATHDQGAR